MAISVPAKRRWWSRERPGTPAASAVAAEDAARIDAVTVARAAVAACLFGAAAIHFAFAPDHFGESRFHGAFFFLAGWAQIGLGIAVLLRPSRALLRAVILVNVGLVLVWAMSRLVGMPFGDDPWAPESLGVPDALASALELLAVVGAYGLLTARWSTRRMSRGLAVGGGIVLAAALVGLTTASVAPALAGSHSHAAIGHVHGAVTAGAAGAASAATHTHTATGGSAGDPTAHAAASVPAGIEVAAGTSPCEQSGAVGEDGSGAGGHGHHGPSPQQAITDPATRKLLGEQLAAARTAALQYPTAADAMAAGYRKVTSYIPCIAAHYMRFAFVDAVFDPSAPEMLLYDGNGPDARIVGLSYYVSGTTVAPEGFAGPNDPWHQHIGLCVKSGVVVGGTQLTPEECAARGGTKADGSTSWMVHAWVVPGWESAWGTFSAENPELGTSVAH